MDKKNVLKDRGKKYGDFEDNAEITQSLYDVIVNSKNFKLFPKVYREAIHMIFHKIARIASGNDIYYKDNVVDIVGYASLLQQFLEQKNEEGDNCEK